jgi:hypothetical protein
VGDSWREVDRQTDRHLQTNALSNGHAATHSLSSCFPRVRLANAFLYQCDVSMWRCWLKVLMTWHATHTHTWEVGNERVI